MAGFKVTTEARAPRDEGRSDGDAAV